MKFDIVRAWKDETYRQSLAGEAVPANPAGEMELTNEELEYGWGGSFGGGCCGGGFFGFSHERFHSLAFRCNETVFSITTVSGFNVLSPVTPICVNEEEGFI